MIAARDALVDEVAAEIAQGGTPIQGHERAAARAILDLIRSRLSDVTPEMVEAWKRVPTVNAFKCSDGDIILCVAPPTKEC
jgi:hypothetical protein